jgi:hypothetical protein
MRDAMGAECEREIRMTVNEGIALRQRLDVAVSDP